MYDSLILSFRSLQAMYATLSEVNQLIVRTKDENSLFSQIPNRIIQRGLFVNSFIVLFDSNLNIKTSFSYEKSDYLDFLKRHLNSNDPEIKKRTAVYVFVKIKNSN